MVSTSTASGSFRRCEVRSTTRTSRVNSWDDSESNSSTVRSMMDSLRGVVFDLDGPLIDSGGDIVMAVNHALEVHDRPRVAATTILRFVGDGARMLCSRAAGMPEK